MRITLGEIVTKSSLDAANKKQATEKEKKIRQFQSACANALLEKGFFEYRESWHQEFKKYFIDANIPYLKYEDAVICAFLGWDLIAQKKKIF